MTKLFYENGWSGVDIEPVLHHVRGHVLSETAIRLPGALRPGQIVARIRGDEFVVAALDLGHPEIEDLHR